MTLEEIYGDVKQICFQDEKGVYLDGQKVALNNSKASGYIRRNGERTLEPISAHTGDYYVDQPLLFVGAYPKGDSLKVERATIAALVACGVTIVSSSIDKNEIAESEGMQLEDLKKFNNVALVMVSYVQRTAQHFDISCDYELC